MNYLIITIGNRDVQINRDVLDENGWKIYKKQEEISSLDDTKKDEYIIKKGVLKLNVSFHPNIKKGFQIFKPREGGESILEEFEDFFPILSLPIIEKFIEKLTSEGLNFDKVLLIHTDQALAPDKSNEIFHENDTINFSEIIRRYLISRYKISEESLDEFCITTNLVDIDYQYQFFEKNLAELIWNKKEDIQNVYLLAQGGIDQVNQALTLRLIEHFPDKLKLYQQKEGASNPISLDFPHLFLENIKKHKIKEHLEYYDFGFIMDLTKENFDEWRKTKNQSKTAMVLIYDESLRAYKRLNLMYDNESLVKNHDRLIDIYLAAKISFKQRKYGDCVTKLYTLFENFFFVGIEKITNQNFKDKLIFQNYLTSNPNIGLPAVEKSIWNKLKSANQFSKIEERGSRWGYYGIYKYLFVNNQKFYNFSNITEIETLFYQFERLIEKRNALVHSMKKVELPMIEQTLDSQNSKGALERLFLELDKHLGIDSHVRPFDFFDDIKMQIKNHL